VLGRGTNFALRVHHELQIRPLGTISRLCVRTRLTTPTVTKALRGLERLRIVRETTKRKRGRVFAYSAFLGLLNEGTQI
jgi:Fic family protein